MEPDTIQIGNWIISKIFLDILAPLVGTIIGGLISYFSVMGVENRKVKQIKQDAIKEQRREAIKIALQWLDPLHNAISKVNMKANPYFPSDADADDWPNLINQLKKFDVPRHLLIFLPEETYEKSFAIIRYIEELKISVIQTSQSFAAEINIQEEAKRYFETNHSLLDKIQNIYNELSKLLEDEYRKTFL